jgi:protein dithiol oxidoreductase (disulfide-forming)
MNTITRAGRRRFLRLAALLPLAAGTSSVPAREHLEEGVHYRRIAQDPVRAANGRIEVIDFFWYGCPHCYDLLPHLLSWRKTMPDDVAYRHVPPVLNPSWEAHAHAYYVSEALGLVGRTHAPLFDAIHRDRRPLHDEQDLSRFFAEHGAEEATFRELWRSFAVTSKVKQATQLARRFRIQSVPSLVVGGTYLTSPSLAGSHEGMIAVLDSLTDRARRG